MDIKDIRIGMRIKTTPGLKGCVNALFDSGIKHDNVHARRTEEFGIVKKSLRHCGGEVFIVQHQYPPQGCKKSGNKFYAAYYFHELDYPS